MIFSNPDQAISAPLLPPPPAKIKHRLRAALESQRLQIGEERQRRCDGGGAGLTDAILAARRERERKRGSGKRGRKEGIASESWESLINFAPAVEFPAP